MAQVVDTEQDIGPVRSPLDTSALDRLLSNNSTPPRGVHLGYGTAWSPLRAPLSIEQFKFGQSNPTYLLTDADGKKAVLRKKPSSNAKLISKTAHAIEREFYMLDAILKTSGSSVPIARPYFLCEDEQYVGAVFYVMEFVKGRIFHDPSLSVLKDEAERDAIWHSVVDVALAIHSVNAQRLFDELPEKHFRKPASRSKQSSAGYFARQVKSLSKIQQLQSETVKPIPHFDELSQWLLKYGPEDPPHSTLIHGDFKIDNLVFHPTEPRVIAVLDWELCTMGHPLFDLSNLLQPFMMTPEMNLAFSKFDIKQDPELVSKVLGLYRSGLRKSPVAWRWDPEQYWKAGTVFGLYRVGVICQGIAQRVEKGIASSAQAKQTSLLFPLVGEFAYKLIKVSKL